MSAADQHSADDRVPTTRLACIGRRVAGTALLAVGLVLAVPGVPGPGLAFILFGLALLLPVSPGLRKRYVALKRRHPGLLRWFEAHRHGNRNASGRG